MNALSATLRLSALAQESRLAVFRLLMKAGPEGVAAGDIARAVKVAPNTLSAQLNILSEAGLVAARRQGRSMIYAVDYTAMTALLVYLMDDCCQGRPEICLPVAELARGARGSRGRRTKTSTWCVR